MPFGKWQDFDACVSDFKAQGKDEESAKNICGALQAKLGKESFSWTGELETYKQAGEYKYYAKGKAIHPCKTVHPEEWPATRVYLEEELQKAAHTLSGMPLSLDHLLPLDGKVVAVEYEDGAIEYVAGHNDDQIDTWVKDGTIKHCSVDYDWGSLVRLNGDVAPKDITFYGLALLKDFMPGDPATNVEVWEALARRLKEAKMLSEQKDEENKQAQKTRAEKYGISPKEGGNLTKPEEFKDLSDDQFADPVNYRYPVDKDHVQPALTYFNQSDNRKDYGHEEQVKILAKIVAAALGNGIEVSWQPEDPVYKDLSEEQKKKLKGYDGKGKEQTGLTVDGIKQRIQQLETQRRELYNQADALWPEIDALKQTIQAMIQRQVAGDIGSLPLECKKLYSDLEAQATVLMAEKKALEEKFSTLENEKKDLVKRLGEGVIDPSGKPKVPEGYIEKKTVLDLIEAVIPSRQIVFSHGQTGGFHRLVDDILNAKKKIEET
jgi:regulator of replication initiation timing